MTLWDELIYVISSQPESEAVGEAFNKAGFLFERSNAHSHDALWPVDVRQAPVDDAGRARLREVILTIIREQPEHPRIVSAFWALSKLEDPSLRAPLELALAYYLKHGEPADRPLGSSVLFQVIVALSSAGVDVFEGSRPDPHDTSALERCARRYLTKPAGA